MNAPSFTTAQSDVLAVIGSYVLKHGFPPSITEIAETMGYRSANAAKTHVDALVKKGALSQTYGRARALSLTVLGATIASEHKFDPKVSAHRASVSGRRKHDYCKPTETMLAACATWGVPPAELEQLRAWDAAGVYDRQRANARARKIPWLFTPATWWRVWKDSGKFEQRGTHTGEYVMCRPGDEGPYAPWNVRIDLSSENVREGIAVRTQRRRADAHVDAVSTRAGEGA